MPKQNDYKTVQCENCFMQIDLACQEVKDLKACNWCGDRDFLLNLTTSQAAFMYAINPESLGKRLRPQFE